MRDITLIVYGTLRKGSPNHFYLDNAEFIGYGVLEGFAFCQGQLTIREYPGMFTVVEVYRISEEELAEIDWLEGYPKVYNRRKVEAMVLSDNYQTFTEIELPLYLSGNRDYKKVKGFVYIIENIRPCAPVHSYDESENQLIANLTREEE